VVPVAQRAAQNVPRRVRFRFGLVAGRQVDLSGIRRKLAAAVQQVPLVASGAERGWPMALARAARDALDLPVEVTGMVASRQSLTELLELPPERALIAVLEGPGEGLGLLVLSPPVLAAMIEIQTMGRVAAGPAPPRKPTRTDAAMVAGFIDRALADIEAVLALDPDLVWAGGFRYASFLDDPRPLGLLLEDTTYRVFQADVALAKGAKAGAVLLALPATGRGVRPAMAKAAPDAGSAQVFAAALAEQVMLADCRLEAVLFRMTIPLSAVMGLAAGDLVPLPMAALDRIGFEGLDGRRLAEGKLGQNRGMRAVRLSAPAVADMPDNVIAMRAVGMG